VNALSRPIRWILVAATVIVGRQVALFVLDPSLATVASIAVAVLIASLLLWGSRLIWLITLVEVGYSLISSDDSGAGLVNIAAGSIIVICLLTPTSFRFMWTQRPERRAGQLRSAANRLSEHARTLTYGVFIRNTGWEDSRRTADATPEPRSYWLLGWRLGVSSVVLFLLVLATSELQQMADGKNLIWNVVANVTWLCWFLVQIAFIVIVIVAAYQRFVGVRLPRSKPQ
jgi:hypothetical protein